MYTYKGKSDASTIRQDTVRMRRCIHTKGNLTRLRYGKTGKDAAIDTNYGKSDASTIRQDTVRMRRYIHTKGNPKRLRYDKTEKEAATPMREPRQFQHRPPEACALYSYLLSVEKGVRQNFPCDIRPLPANRPVSIDHTRQRQLEGGGERRREGEREGVVEEGREGVVEAGGEGVVEAGGEGVVE